MSGENAMSMNVKVAVAQIDARVGDLKGNLEHHCESVEAARKLGARLVIFPELSLTGYSLRDLAWEVALDPAADPRLARLRKASKQVSVAFGCVEGGSDHGIYNSAVFLEDGEVRHIHRKVYPPTYGMFEEGRYFSAGSSVCAFESRHGRFGMLICEDMWHVTLPYLLAYDGAEAIFCLTASPTRLGADRTDLDNRVVNHEHQRSYARLLSIYTVFANRAGFEDGVNFWGGSAIMTPSGVSAATAKLFDEDLISAPLLGTDIQRARRFSRHMLDERMDIVLRNLQKISDRRR